MHSLTAGACGCGACSAPDSLARCNNCGEWLCLACFAGHSCLAPLGRVLICSCSGARLRRADTRGVDQGSLDRACTGPDRPCYPGCFRSRKNAWSWIKPTSKV